MYFAVGDGGKMVQLLTFSQPVTADNFQFPIGDDLIELVPTDNPTDLFLLYDLKPGFPEVQFQVEVAYPLEGYEPCIVNSVCEICSDTQGTY